MVAKNSCKRHFKTLLLVPCLGVGAVFIVIFILQGSTEDRFEVNFMSRGTKNPQIKGEDSFDQYFRNLKAKNPDLSLSCLNWSKVKTPTHPYKLPTNVGKVKFAATISESESSVHRKDSFGKIYAKNAWGSETKSGPGSLLSSTVRIRQILDLVVEKLKIHLKKDIISLLDSSCGDMTWMPTFLKGRKDVEFTGFDIVPENIENHRNNFKEQNWKFEVHDIVTDALNSSYDLILSRHTTQHLKTADVLKVVQNFITSGSKYLLTSNYPDVKSNLDLSEDSQYRHRPLNFFLKPFYLPPPICMAMDVKTDSIMLWDLRTVSLEV